MRRCNKTAEEMQYKLCLLGKSDRMLVNEKIAWQSVNATISRPITLPAMKTGM
jgi:hypothetical protein